MNLDILGPQLHHRSTLGEPLSAEEQVLLDTWYAEQDAIEAAILAKSQIVPPDLNELQGAIDRTLTQLNLRINILHQSNREERIRLAAWENDRPFSLLGELEILASTIQGYIGQFTSQQLNHPTMAIADLQQRNPFEIPELADWYSTDGKNYPNLCRYLELLDHLRLSLLAIIQANSLQAA